VTASQPQPRQLGHLDFLDGLRAVAALLVVAHHAQLEVWFGVASWTRYAGRLAVDVFIAISGFCLTLPVARDRFELSAPRFFWRRARRILPPYYIATAVSLALIYTCIGDKTGTTWDQTIPVTRNGIAAVVLMLVDVFHRGEINHVFWSVAVEWKIYCVFPLLLLLARRIGVLAASGLAVAAGLAVFAVVHETGAPAGCSRACAIGRRG
jgi:peptidoglycan/LPS O-acetylase OafA/YrhL